MIVTTDAAAAIVSDRRAALERAAAQYRLARELERVQHQTPKPPLDVRVARTNNPVPAQVGATHGRSAA